jgi:hypothetical protein
MTVKICSICEEEKPLDQFCRDRSSRDGHSHRCRSCNSGTTRRNHFNHRPEKPIPESVDLYLFGARGIEAMKRVGATVYNARGGRQ